ncbi:MAG: hypothetical protein GX591_00375 [Planctomycetes bacterium]|nr:hypothetical protein [Planctomycetota bacterium]
MISFRPGVVMFNTKAIRNHVDWETRKVLSKFGAFVRQTAKRSIRNRKTASPPGSPPSSHTGLLRRFIWFGYEPGKRSVVIGPAKLSQKGRGEAPSLLEYGGSTTLKRGGKRRRTRIRARPFMGPAFEKERTKLSALWRDSIN